MLRILVAAVLVVMAASRPTDPADPADLANHADHVNSWTSCQANNRTVVCIYVKIASVMSQKLSAVKNSQLWTALYPSTTAETPAHLNDEAEFVSLLRQTRVTFQRILRDFGAYKQTRRYRTETSERSMASRTGTFARNLPGLSTVLGYILDRLRCGQNGATTSTTTINSSSSTTSITTTSTTSATPASRRKRWAANMDGFLQRTGHKAEELLSALMAWQEHQKDSHSCPGSGQSA